MLLLKMGPEVPSRARRALPALRRSEKAVGHPNLLVYINVRLYFIIYFVLVFPFQKGEFGSKVLGRNLCKLFYR